MARDRDWRGRPARTPGEERADSWAYAEPDLWPELAPSSSVGLVGSAEGAPLSQGRDGSIPLELEGVDLTEPHLAMRVRGEPTEPAIHAPTTRHIEPRPVATGECTVETVEGEPLCEEEDA